MNPASKPIVISDTNIFSYLLDEKIVEQIIKILEEVEKDYELAWSAVTRYELICKGTQKMKKVVDILDRFKAFNVDRKVFGFAALFFCLGVKGVGDSIIAATALLNKTYLLTADGSDFPEPYFSEEKHWIVKSVNSKNRVSALVIHLLKVNIKETLASMNNVDYLKKIEEENPT